MNVDSTLDQLARDPAAECDLAALSLYLARDEFPELEVDVYLDEIEDMADRLRPRLQCDLIEQVTALSQFLFDEQGFAGNRDDYHNPDNSHFNRVLERRQGLPITLSMLAAAVGNRAGLIVEGIGLPGHFIARATDRAEAVYFDPFHGGQPLSIADCEHLVESVTGQPFEATTEVLVPSPPGAIVRRMLTNLKNAYARQHDLVRAARTTRRILQLEPTNALERRDLGACLVQIGCAGEAIDLLESYLNSSPNLSDADSIRKLLRKAKSEVARWN